MALPDLIDERTGEIIHAPQRGDASAGAATSSATGRNQAWLDAIVARYRELLGRDPNASELDEAYVLMAAGREDELVRNLTQRKGSPAAGAFTWSDYGATPEGFGEPYTAGSFTAPQFQERFNAPTVEDMLKDPGYRSRMDEMQRGVERSAAAKGSILSGGFVGRALPRALGEAASNEYSNTFKRAFDTYQQRYGMFSDQAGREANAFAMNETGKLNQYQQRYTSYKDLVNQRRQSEEDRWRREMDLAQLGLGGAGAY